MQWPWVSRRQLVACNVGWHEENRALKRALALAEARTRDEQWRRIKAEGHVAYMQERIMRVLGLPGF